MKVGFVGLGKLGLPVATAMASRGLEVYGHDPRTPDVEGALQHEEGFAEVWAQASRQRTIRFTSLAEVVENCEVIFCAVQTPHEPRFEGVTPLPQERADFDYSHLKTAVSQIVAEVEAQNRNVTLAVISTVLPGTMAREIQPLLPPSVWLCYSPSFIAMGTTISDFLNPEFVLIGGADGVRADVMQVFDQAGVTTDPRITPEVGRTGPSRFYATSIPNAELIKVAYNTFIGLKLAFANTLMEVCHKTDCDVDEVTGALKLAHRRLISGAYLDGGMGDGGGCHPRDNIALSWLARELDLSHDLFEDAMLAREHQAEWLADLMCEYDLPKGILGTAYKPGSHITTGSAAELVRRMVKERSGRECAPFDPHVLGAFWPLPPSPFVWLVGCKHPEFADLKLPEGSVVIDPWRYIPDQPGVEVISVGRSRVPAPSAV